MMTTTWTGRLLPLALPLLVLVACTSSTTTSTTPPAAPEQHLGRVLIVNSYHTGYRFSDRAVQAVLQGLGVAPEAIGDDDQTPVAVRLRYLDGKRFPDQRCLTERAARIAEDIRTWPADLVITCDDYATEYVLARHVVRMGLPGVFCGVNLSADRYHLPPEQVTGMIERNLFSAMIAALREHAAGDRVAYLGADTETNRVQAEELRQCIGTQLVASRFYDTLSGFDTGLDALIPQADMVVLGNAVPVIRDADDPNFAAMRERMRACPLPSGTTSAWHAPLVLMTFAKSPEEMGLWAARQALAILRGTSPAAIPRSRNEHYQLSLNMDLAKRLGVRWPVEFLERAHLISAETDSEAP